MPLVLGLATLVFFVVHVAPGDPVDLMGGRGLSPEAAAAMRANLGLDRPLPVQYVKWLAAFVTGDFGYSYTYQAPVRSVLADLLPNTLVLGAGALVLSFGFGIALGVVQAVRQNSATDSVLSFVLLFFYSMPSFWLALMLVLVFSLLARNVWDWPIWFPASGMTSVDHAFLPPWDRFVERLRYLTLPTLSLSLVLTAGIARFMRGSMLEVVHQDYVRTARAKGLSEVRVVVGHALRNALLPIATLAGLYVPMLLSGTVFIERVFAWPGMGQALVQAVLARDYPMVMAGSFVFGVMVVFGSLLADVLYAWIDPRVRYARGGTGHG